MNGSDEIVERVKRNSTCGHRNGTAVTVESGEGILPH